jgi:hypothetical protein
MNFLAGLTGGRSFYNTNGIEDSIRQAIQDSELTYTLGFYPAEESQDGLTHKLTVKVMRHGVSVRHRETYLAFKPGTDSRHVATLAELLRDPLDAGAVGFTVEATADAAKAGAWQLRLTVDIHDLQLDHEQGRRRGALDVSFASMRSGTVHTRTFPIEMPDEQFPVTLEKGMVINDFFRNNGAGEDLRVVVRDHATGAAGSLRVALKPEPR